METGAEVPGADFVGDCDTYFEMRGALKTVARLARHTAGLPSWFRWWAEQVESRAHTLRSWQPTVIDGLLQTPDYARALLRRVPGATEEQIEERAAARLGRQKILDGENPPRLWVMMDEGVLHREMGGPKVMHDQLQALIDASERPNVTTQVVPTGAQVPGLGGAFAIASINASLDLLYLEYAHAGRVSELPDDVQEIANYWEAIRTEALTPRLSLDLISKVMEQWT